MIEILHFISDKNIGGAGRLLLNLISEADRQNFRHSAVLPRGSLLAPRIRELGCEIRECSMSLSEAISAIKHFSPYIVHTHASATARVAARLCGVPVIINTKHCAEDGEHSAGLFKRGAVRLFDCLFTDCTVATAEYVKNRLIADGIPKNKILVIINGSIGLKELSASERAKAREAFGYSENDFIVGIVARLEMGKGHETFIEAARICHEKYPEIKFLIAGNGTSENRLRELARGLENLKFLGFIEDVTPIMNILDANVSCSYISETSSLSLSEGMSVGAIPVVSDCGGNPFMAQDCGLVFPKQDSLALAKSVIFLYKNNKEAARLKKEAKKRFSNYFTAEKMARETEQLYSELLQARRR